MSTPAGGTEIRQRAGGNVQHQQRRNSSTNSLPRPGASPIPRSSPTHGKRTYSSGGSIPAIPPPYGQQQRSGSMTSMGSSHSSHGVSDPRTASSSSYARSSSYSSVGSGTHAYTAAAAAAASQIGGGSTYAAAGGYAPNGYSNGTSSSTGGGGGGMSRRDSDNKYNKPKNRRGGAANAGGGSRMAMVVGVVLMFVYSIIITIVFFSDRGRTNTLLKRLALPDTISIVNKVEDLERRLKTTETTKQRSERNALTKSNNRINLLEREKKTLEREKNAFKNEHLPAAQEQVQKLTSRETAFADQVGWLMEVTRRESKRMVLERFGPGPHKVEFTFKIESKNKDSDTPDKDPPKMFTFIVELAPLDLVPHAIHLFLEQVDHGLMDGTHFYLNGPHIAQAGPQPKWDTYYDGSDDTFQTYNGEHPNKDVSSNAVGTMKKYEKTLETYKLDQLEYDDDDYVATAADYHKEESRQKAYTDVGLDQLAFPDYSEKYPHRPWTVGFTGRPGGPDWYINKIDNSIGHGPGGQFQYELSEQGDSCFGIISDEDGGRDALAQYLYNGEIYADNSEWHHFLDHPIEIVVGHILTKKPILDHHLHMDRMNGHKIFHNVPRKTEQGQKARERRLQHEAELAADENMKRQNEINQRQQHRQQQQQGQQQQHQQQQQGQQRQHQQQQQNRQKIREQPNRGRVPHIDGAQQA